MKRFNQTVFSKFYPHQERPILYSVRINSCAKLFQLCPTLCNPMGYSPSGSSVPGLSRQNYWSGLPCPTPLQSFRQSRIYLRLRSLCIYPSPSSNSQSPVVDFLFLLIQVVSPRNTLHPQCSGPRTLILSSFQSMIWCSEKEQV